MLQSICLWTVEFVSEIFAILFMLLWIDTINSYSLLYGIHCVKLPQFIHLTLALSLGLLKQFSY